MTIMLIYMCNLDDFMVRINKMISITPEQDKFIQENNINVSQFVQNHINIMMENGQDPNYLTSLIADIEQQRQLRDKWMQMFYKLREFTDSKGLQDEVLRLFNH